MKLKIIFEEVALTVVGKYHPYEPMNEGHVGCSTDWFEWLEVYAGEVEISGIIGRLTVEAHNLFEETCFRAALKEREKMAMDKAQDEYDRDSSYRDITGIPIYGG